MCYNPFMEINLKKIDEALETIKINKESVLSNCPYSSMKRKEQEIIKLIVSLGSLKNTILNNEDVEPEDISERIDKLTKKVELIIK